MNLVPLFEEALEFQNYNGTVLSNGKVAVFYIGRTRLADIFNDIEGLSPAENPRVLDNLGMGPIYVNPAFDYEMVVYDAYDNELFSVKKYVLSKGEHSTANVVVTPSEHIAVSAWTIGDVQVYMPYLVGEVGKTYEGILPIVVNNDVNRISANHIPLGVQEPLYFVEDSETACILGCSAQTEIPSELSGKWDNAADAVIANSAQWAEGTEYEAGSYVDIDGHTISVTGLQPEGDYAYNSALSSKLDVTATGQFLTGLPEDLVYSADITGLATTAQLDEKLDKSDSGNFYPMEGNPSGFLTAHQSLQGYATEQWVEGKGYLTSVDIPESATWNATTQTVSANSAQWAGGTANPQIPVTGINGIKISESGDKVVFEVSGDYYPGNNPSGFITGVDLSDYATTAQVSEKLDTTAFSDVSGTFLTAHQDLTDYQTTAGMTAYQEAGDYYSASNPSGFITGVDLTPYQLTADMTAYQPTGDYLTTADSANFYTTANESGFISEVPAGTMNESEFEYSDGMITAYNGSAFKTGDEFPESATEAIQVVTGHSADWGGTTETVSANSADWGGSTLNLSSRDGIDLELDDNTLYIGASAITASITGKQDKLTFDYNANDAISAINGSAIGGSDVPEGVMVESGLEYNAVNEISGYNGSAIAQYGAEKQWLVHDDTLVHASNSAQYALGVNLSAVAQLLGVDETVLWSGNLTGNGATAQLSEPITNFERIKVYGHTDDGIYYPWFTEFYPAAEGTTCFGVATNNNGWAKWFYFTITPGGLYTNVTGRVLTFGTTTWGNLDYYGMTRVVGIGRKQ